LVNTEIYNLPQINNEVIIYPNPSNGIFNIVCSNNENFNLEVISLQGNKILDTEFQGKHTLNLSHLNKGVYLVKIHGSDIIHTQKIIIQ
jgi:hypothetical protein